VGVGAAVSIAVKKILRGRQRDETNRVIAFRSQWGFQSEYNPASGNEKGGVEGEVDRYRRNYRAPPWPGRRPNRRHRWQQRLKSAQNDHFRLALSPPHEQ
jgi:hypothetical protein